jgi:GT2 family glycosyltransferase
MQQERIATGQLQPQLILLWCAVSAFLMVFSLPPPSSESSGNRVLVLALFYAASRGKSGMASSRVSIVILNWKGWEDTVECLESLYQIDYDNYEVIVLDNGSQDDSVDRIREYCAGQMCVKSRFFGYDPDNKPIQIIEVHLKELKNGTLAGEETGTWNLASNRKLRLILSDRNLGFAEGCDACMRYALDILNSSYVLLLNNDTVVERGFLTQLVRVSLSDKRIGVVGPKIYFYDRKGRTDLLNYAGGTYDMKRGRLEIVGYDEVDKGQYNEQKEGYDLISGCCMLIKADIIRKIGFLDPVYFMYGEDLDYCKRVSMAGYRLIYVPSSVIWHKSSHSFTPSISAFYLGRNGFIFVKKYAEKRQFSYFVGYQLIYWGWVSAISFLVPHRDIKGFAHYVRGTLHGIIWVLSLS